MTTQPQKERWLTRFRRFFTIDYHMLPTKASYLLFGGILGSHIPYVYAFFTSVGLTKTQAGLITGIRFGPSSISGPLWGMLADYTGRRKLILILLCCGSAFPMFMMPWIAQWIYPRDYNKHNETYGVLPNILPYSDVTESFTSNRIVPDSLFYVLLFVMISSSLFVGPLPNYVDSIVMNVVKTSRYEVNYGAQRIYGSFGFALASFVAGVAADHYNSPNLSKYTSVFFIYLPCTILLIPIGSYLVGQTRWEEETDTTQKQSSTSNGGETTEPHGMASKICRMFAKGDILLLVGTVIVSGLACNVFNTFALKLLKDVTNENDTKISLAFVIATIAEVFMFPFNTKIIVLCRGTSIPLMLGIFSYFVRFLVMTYTDKLWILLLVQVLHGVGFALHWSAMMEYLHRVTPKEIILSIFLIFQSLQFGLAAVVANVAGGVLYEKYGGIQLFRWKAFLCGGWCLVMAVYYAGKKLFKKRIGSAGKYAFNSRENNNREVGIDNTGVSCQIETKEI